jgi:hypothetical protein
VPAQWADQPKNRAAFMVTLTEETVKDGHERFRLVSIRRR